MFVRPQNKKRQNKPTTPCRGVVSAPEGEHGKMLFLKQSKEPQTDGTMQGVVSAPEEEVKS